MLPSTFATRQGKTPKFGGSYDSRGTPAKERNQRPMNPEAVCGPADPPYCGNCNSPLGDCDCQAKFSDLLIGVVFYFQEKRYLKVATDIARRLDRPDQGLCYQTFTGQEQCTTI